MEQVHRKEGEAPPGTTLQGQSHSSNTSGEPRQQSSASSDDPHVLTKPPVTAALGAKAYPSPMEVDAENSTASMTSLPGADPGEVLTGAHRQAADDSSGPRAVSGQDAVPHAVSEETSPPGHCVEMIDATARSSGIPQAGSQPTDLWENKQATPAMEAPDMQNQQVPHSVEALDMQNQQVPPSVEAPAMQNQQVPPAMEAPAMQNQQATPAVEAPAMEDQQVPSSVEEPAMEDQRGSSAAGAPTTQSPKHPARLLVPRRNANQNDIEKIALLVGESWRDFGEKMGFSTEFLDQYEQIYSECPLRVSSILNQWRHLNNKLTLKDLLKRLITAGPRYADIAKQMALDEMSGSSESSGTLQ